MSAYHAAAWHDYFLAQAGAAAALTGLIFVAVSINLQQILRYGHLPGRVAVALLLLMELLLLAMVVLIPDQRRVTLGVELLVLAVAFWLLVLTIQIRNLGRIDTEHHDEFRRLQLRWVAIAQCATLPPVVAAITLLAHAGGGLYWLAAGTVLAFTAGVGEGWVLLIEIER